MDISEEYRVEPVQVRLLMVGLCFFIVGSYFRYAAIMLLLCQLLIYGFIMIKALIQYSNHTCVRV